MAFSGSVARVALLLFKRTQLCAVEAIQNENLVCFTVWLCEACITAFLHLTLSHRKEYNSKRDNKLLVNGPYGNGIVAVCETIPEASGKSA